jgi:hypothetical protein
MDSPTIVAGRLTNPKIKIFLSLRVAATFQLLAGATATTARQATQARPDGTFRLQLPPAGQWQGPLTVTVSGASGRMLGSAGPLDADAPADVLGKLTVPVTADDAPALVLPSHDPTLGALFRFSGRVIDHRGYAHRAGLLVVLWGVAPGATQAYPLAVAETTQGGYMAGPWPSALLLQAYARVAGGPAIDIALEDGRLPHRIIVMADHVPAEDGRPGNPPRGPTAEELATQAETFAADTGCCTTFTMPNRTVEEVHFHAVVRTTQPAIRGNTRPRPLPIPPGLVQRIAALAARQPAIMDATATPPPPVALAPLALGGAAPMLDIVLNHEGRVLDPPPPPPAGAGTVPHETLDQRAARVLAARAARAEPLVLEQSVVADLAREQGGITPARLLQAERTSLVRSFRQQVDALASTPPDRLDLNGQRQIGWDGVPLACQATEIAHGHLLTMKQVWRADGYSLGDVLYSLALAPGQQKLISILDWERRAEARRTERRSSSEDLSADLGHDRDIADIVRSALHERMEAQSSARVSSVGGGFGGFIGPVVFGAAGGSSSAGSGAHQASSRDITATALNSARDRTLQAASAVRGQRATVVQSGREGESVLAQTEAIANNNHCHALTVEYFEVLRHFQVSQELAHVQECLLVPFAVSPFTRQKALRWRAVLQDMSVPHGDRDVRLAPLFDALQRATDNWAHVDLPAARYADEPLRELDGELRLTMSIPRPADTVANGYDAATWGPYQQLLGAASAAALQDIWTRFMGVAQPADRPDVWNTRLAPVVARRMVDQMVVELGLPDGTYSAPVNLDLTLVSPYRPGAMLLATFRAAGAMPALARAQVARVRLGFPPNMVPAQVETTVQSGSMRYRTDYATRALFADYRILNDLGSSDAVEIPTPLDRTEKNDPRQGDRRLVRTLLDILNEHVEFMHRVIWLSMDPNRRFMFLDGVLAPDADGRSVASVVENRVIGIVGNSLVMPVVPGLKLDPTYEFAAQTTADLRQHYAADPPPPMRVSVPTRGVFAEAVMGACNSCEHIDDTKFWHWDEAPIPDAPAPIDALSTASRATTAPSVTPSDYPDALVAMQNAPAAPDPSGLSAALGALGTTNLFRDLTGLALNQENASGALKSVLSTAQSFASQGAALAQQKFLNGQVDRNLDLIKAARERKQITPEQAQEMTESMFRGALGERRPESEPVTDNPAVQRVMERAASSDSAEMRLTRPGGSVEVKTGRASGGAIDVALVPPLVPLKPAAAATCWAAAAAMLQSWKTRQASDIVQVLDGLGGSWRARYDNNEALTGLLIKAFTDAIGLQTARTAGLTADGLSLLIADEGPLWVVGAGDVTSHRLNAVHVACAIAGDGSATGTTVTLIDARTGEVVSETFAVFAKRFETVEPMPAGVGILHFRRLGAAAQDVFSA